MASAIETHLFTFKGKNRKGEKVDGEVRANNLVGAKSSLRKQGIISTSVKKKAKPLLNRPKKIVPADIAIFTRQLATMMKAGVPLVQSFEIVADGSDKPFTLSETPQEVDVDWIISESDKYSNFTARNPL